MLPCSCLHVFADVPCVCVHIYIYIYLSLSIYVCVYEPVNKEDNRTHEQASKQAYARRCSSLRRYIETQNLCTSIFTCICMRKYTGQKAEEIQHPSIHPSLPPSVHPSIHPSSRLKEHMHTCFFTRRRAASRHSHGVLVVMFLRVCQ